jgi:2-oxoglutarate ferredoxin oxidoreductase subunit alpha
MPDQVEELFIPEMNMGQLFREVVRVSRGKRLTHKINKVTGELMTPEEIVYKIKQKGA